MITEADRETLREAQRNAIKEACSNDIHIAIRRLLNYVIKLEERVKELETVTEVLS